MELNEQDWDLIDDDGFVCRRLKRTRLDPATTVSSSPSDPPPDPAAEAKSRKERKKNTLLKLKQKYQKEIDQWGLLSNTLQALQKTPQTQPFPAPQLLSDLPESSSEETHRELANTLLAKVEAQEVFIAEASRLCDVVEALCDSEEQRLKQPFFDLPIWEPSPKELMTSLLEE